MGQGFNLATVAAQSPDMLPYRSTRNTKLLAYLLAGNEITPRKQQASQYFRLRSVLLHPGSVNHLGLMQLTIFLIITRTGIYFNAEDKDNLR
jgi:hypothetical protein